MPKNNTTTTAPEGKQDKGNGQWQDEIEKFYKILGKFSQNADLIRRVIAKVDREKVSPLLSENEKLKEDKRELVEVLNKIKNWQLPATGQFWDREEKQPLSYGAAYGSNGERDYFKNIASEAIAKHNQ